MADRDRRNLHPLLHSINTTAFRLNVSRSEVYRLIGNGRLVRVKIGRRSLVTNASMIRLVEEAVK